MKGVVSYPWEMHFWILDSRARLYPISSLTCLNWKEAKFSKEKKNRDDVQLSYDHKHMDNEHVMRAFTIIPQIMGRFGHIGQINCGVFGVFPVELLSLCVHSPWFFINKPLLLQKHKLLRHFKGKSIWDWNMNLGCKELVI